MACNLERYPDMQDLNRRFKKASSSHRNTLLLRSAVGFFAFMILLGVFTGDSLQLAELFGHENDPKARNVPPPYNGPGYRQGAGGPQTFGPVGGIGDGVQLLSWVTLPEMQPGIANGNDCWGYTSPSGREYALMAHSSGTTVIEVTNPGNPQMINETFFL